jgi:hypothetical protein
MQSMSETVKSVSIGAPRQHVGPAAGSIKPFALLTRIDAARPLSMGTTYWTVDGELTTADAD